MMAVPGPQDRQILTVTKTWGWPVLMMTTTLQARAGRWDLHPPQWQQHHLRQCFSFCDSTYFVLGNETLM